MENNNNSHVVSSNMVGVDALAFMPNNKLNYVADMNQESQVITCWGIFLMNSNF